MQTNLNFCNIPDPNSATFFLKEGYMSVEERIQKIVCEQLGVSLEEAKLEASFVDDLGADSLDTVELVIAFEEEFEIEIPDEEAEEIATIKNAIDYINSNS